MEAPDTRGDNPRPQIGGNVQPNTSIPNPAREGVANRRNTDTTRNKGTEKVNESNKTVLPESEQLGTTQVLPTTYPTTNPTANPTVKPVVKSNAGVKNREIAADSGVKPARPVFGGDKA